MNKIRKKAICFDIDWTLCFLNDAETPYNHDGEEISTWLYESLIKDLPHDTLIVIITWRKKREYGELTKQWLRKNNIRCDYLFMQEWHTAIKNYIFKWRVLKWLKKIIDIDMMYDDNPDVEFVCELLDIPLTLVNYATSTWDS